MGVTAGTDYAIAKKTTWTYDAGVGSGTAVLTAATLFIFPDNYRAIAALIADPQTTAAVLEGQLQHWVRAMSGAHVENLVAYKRVRIFTSWWRRSVALSKKDSGYDLKPASIRPTKDEMPAFVAMLRGHPHVEIK